MTPTEVPGQPQSRELAVPPITTELREQARAQPGTWLYVVDPAFQGVEDVPGFGIIGGYRVDEHGEIDPEFRANADYLPSPFALGLPAPVNDLEAAMQLSATGYGDQEQFEDELRISPLWTPSRPGIAGPVLVEDGAGRPAVHVFTSEGQLPASWQEWRRTTVAELLPVLRANDLVVNPGSPTSVRIPCDTF
ncbi:type VII secretion system-associated protein [Solihabitans fulvus]|uniref:Type VII secretion system-associated protein n=1 Tax=Solihabitans fulvus TaxID=1892852 RepID=A0A5B2XHY0_9PSEU|nr:type VII secretion system-associated protein [Solihabitans fulvus]KAA2262665.1 type VII secretion system-associated protein [Solihabitans fulvus]